MSEDRTNGESGNNKLLYCSFCGKNQHEVRKLIAGPSVYICDECVELCNDIIREEVKDVAPKKSKDEFSSYLKIYYSKFFEGNIFQSGK